MSVRAKITIIGAGPSGLFCAYLLLQEGYSVEVFDQSSGAAKKLLIAGNGGLNLTHSEELDVFASRYGKDSKLFRELLNIFSPNDLRSWCGEIDIETFIGTSRRVFPKDLKAGKLLTNWLKKLKSFDNFSLHLKHRLLDVDSEKNLHFETPDGIKKVNAEVIVFALGGASWKKTGSDGLWRKIFEKLDIEVKPFLPMNCGFERRWSDFFKLKVERSFIKNLEARFDNISKRGEVMITPYGIEGGLIYAFSNLIRDRIIESGKASLFLDFKPDLTIEELNSKFKKRKKMSLSQFFKKTLKLDPSVYLIFKDLLSPEELGREEMIIKNLKNFEFVLTGIRDIDEAISTSGGVCFDELTKSFELKKISNVYVVGEMLDFEAPTGGYLLQGCFSSAANVVNSITKNN